MMCAAVGASLYPRLSSLVKIGLGSRLCPPLKRGAGGISPTVLEYDHKLRERGRRLRRQMTDSERVLWDRLRRKQIQAVQF